MPVILGIDAGGTFTDCVVVDADSKVVLHKSKSPTTKHDLAHCLEAAFVGIPAHLTGDITMVCLSTTLATNAIVEGRGCREGLIVIGSKPRGKAPTARQRLVKGRFDMKGRLVENIDETEVIAAVESLRHDVDAVAVSGYASVRCPEHELFVRAVLEDRLEVPVVCAHELTSSLGFYERTVTAVLNARLIPMIRDLMTAVHAAMARHGVTAPLMIVRGDGTLMPEGIAATKPIETILSGPAASAMGALHLVGRADCLVMDIGGTTTDIANTAGGTLQVRSDGARVGSWLTHVRAADVFTVGLGGDSRIRLDGGLELRVGPERSISYAMASIHSPSLVEELEEILNAGAHRQFLHPDHEAFIQRAAPDQPGLLEDERAVLRLLQEGPHTAFHLARQLQNPALQRILDDLVSEGAVERISLTPTDFWHVEGSYQAGDPRASGLAFAITAEMLGVTSDTLAVRLRQLVGEAVDAAAIQAALHMDHREHEPAESGSAAHRWNAMCSQGEQSLLRASYRLTKPIVGIGAPAATWLAAGSSVFDAEVPEHAEVANAIGAAVAHAVERVDVLIRQDTVTNRYLVFSPDGREQRPTLDEATACAVRAGERFIVRLANRDAGSIRSEVNDVRITSPATPQGLFVERVVTVTARTGV